ncbi:YjcQ family protein [Lachnospiraceae bacterium ZAX-1]
MPTASAFFEEVIHFAQDRKCGTLDETDFVNIAAREIEANGNFFIYKILKYLDRASKEGGEVDVDFISEKHFGISYE